MEKCTQTLIAPVMYLVKGEPKISNVRCTIEMRVPYLGSIQRVSELIEDILLQHIFTLECDVDVDDTEADISGEACSTSLPSAKDVDFIPLPKSNDPSRKDCMCCGLEQHLYAIFGSRYQCIIECDLADSSMYGIERRSPEQDLAQIVSGTPEHKAGTMYPVGIYLPRVNPIERHIHLIVYINKPLSCNANVILGTYTYGEPDLSDSLDSHTMYVKHPTELGPDARDLGTTEYRRVRSSVVEQMINTLLADHCSLVVLGNTAYRNA